MLLIKLRPTLLGTFIHKITKIVVIVGETIRKREIG